MRFTCEHCQTRYSIPDDRVAGRVLKIRCKRCRSVVEVMGPPPPGSTGSMHPMVQVSSIDTKVERVEPLHGRPELEHRLNGVHLPSQISDIKQVTARPASLPHSDADAWWLGLHGRPTGPLSQDELLVYAQRGTLTSRTYAWRPGQGAWMRVDKAPGLGFLRDAIQRRQRSSGQPRRLTGMETGVFAASGLFDASALAAALQQQARPVALETSREPSGLTQALSQDAAPVQAQDATPAQAPAVQDLAAVSIALARPEPTLTIELEDSGWFVVDERLQQTLWQRDLPPDLPGTTALITGVHLLPQRRRLKAAVTVLVVGALVFASALLVAWVTRDSLALAIAPVPSVGGPAAEGYSPARALVDKVRRALDPSRGGGVRLPTLSPALSPEDAAPAQPAAPRAPSVTGAAVADPAVEWLAPAPQTDDLLPPAAPSQGAASAAQPTIDWTALQAPPPTLDLGAPVMADSPELLPPGELSAEHVARVVQQRLPQLEKDYNAALKRNPALAGVVDTSIVIGRDGRVQQVTVQAPGEENGYLAGLLKQRMARWTFPRPSSELEVVLPLRFKSVY